MDPGLELAPRDVYLEWYQRALLLAGGRLNGLGVRRILDIYAEVSREVVVDGGVTRAGVRLGENLRGVALVARVQQHWFLLADHDLVGGGVGLRTCLRYEARPQGGYRER